MELNSEKTDKSNESLRPDGKKRYYLASLSCWFGAITMGTAAGFTSPTIPQILEQEPFYLPERNVFEGWFGSLMPLGALFGGLAAGWFIETFGRRMSLIICSIPFIIGYLLIFLASSVAYLYAGRFITGFCSGFVTLVIPVYVAETADPKYRGFLGSGLQLSATFGVFMVYTLGKFIDWTWLALHCAIYPLCMLVLMFFMPESPSWLMKKGQDERAEKSLYFLFGNDKELASQVLPAVKKSDGLRTDDINDKFFQRKFMVPFIILLLLQLFQQFSGVNVFIYYSKDIFISAGITSILPSTSIIIVATVQFLATFVGCILIERQGRRVMLLISSVTMILCLLVMSAYYFTLDSLGNSFQIKYGWLTLVALVVFVTGCNLGFGPIPFLMIGELLPMKIRGLGSSLAIGFNWLCVFGVTRTFPDLRDIILPQGVYLMYAIVSVFGLIFVALKVPETKGKSLQEIENLFRDPSDPENGTEFAVLS